MLLSLCGLGLSEHLGPMSIEPECSLKGGIEVVGGSGRSLRGLTTVWKNLELLEKLSATRYMLNSSDSE